MRVSSEIGSQTVWVELVLFHAVQYYWFHYSGVATAEAYKTRLSESRAHDPLTTLEDVVNAYSSDGESGTY